MAKSLKCPRCSKPIVELQMDAIKAALSDQDKKFAAVAFSCPSCRCVLGVQFDPVAVMSGTVKGLASAITAKVAPRPDGKRS